MAFIEGLWTGFSAVFIALHEHIFDVGKTIGFLVATVMAMILTAALLIFLVAKGFNIMLGGNRGRKEV